MQDKAAKFVVDLLSAMQQVRRPWDQVNNQIASFCMPEAKKFWSSDNQETREPILNLYTRDGVSALNRFSAALQGTVNNPATNWFRLTSGAGGNEAALITPWLNEFGTPAVRKIINGAGSRFYKDVLNTYKQVGAFGYSGMFTKEHKQTGKLIFQNWPSHAIWMHEDECGEINCVMRVVSLDARQYKMWFEGKAELDTDNKDVPGQVKQRVNVIRCIVKREFMEGSGVTIDTGNDTFSDDRPWIEIIVDKGKIKTLDTASYDANPVSVLRWNRNIADPYATGPSYTALPQIKGIEHMAVDFFKQLDAATNPTILAGNKDVFQGQNLRTPAGGVIYNGIDNEGRARIQKTMMNGDLQGIFAAIQQSKDEIRDAFHNNDLILQSRPDMTAFEVAQRKAEQAMMMGPFIVQVRDFLEPVLSRTLQVAFAGGLIDTAPPIDNPDFEVTLEGTLAQAQAAQNSAQIAEVIQQAVFLSQFDQTPDKRETLGRIDFSKAMEMVMNPMPELLRSDEEMAGRTAQVDQQAAAQNEAASAAGVNDLASSLEQLTAAGLNQAKADQIAGAV